MAIKYHFESMNMVVEMTMWMCIDYNKSISLLMKMAYKWSETSAQATHPTSNRLKMLLFIIIVLTNYESFWLLLYTFRNESAPNFHFIRKWSDSIAKTKRRERIDSLYLITANETLWTTNIVLFVESIFCPEVQTI